MSPGTAYIVSKLHLDDQKSLYMCAWKTIRVKQGGGGPERRDKEGGEKKA